MLERSQIVFDHGMMILWRPLDGFEKSQYENYLDKYAKAVSYRLSRVGFGLSGSRVNRVNQQEGGMEYIYW